MCSHKDYSHYSRTPSPRATLDGTQNMLKLEGEIWVGYERDARRYIDKRAMRVDACEQMRCLREWWEGLTSSPRQLLARMLFCQRPAVYVGVVGSASLLSAIDAGYPRETQYRSLRRSDLLTRAFVNPQSLVDEADYFYQYQRIQVGKVGSQMPSTRMRHVVFVAYESDRKLLLYPLLLAI
ncbi:hypothetical protein LTR91_008053 [Friedmanniomyces endolithicus]|uniref:Uncharacterized protein n=2 Tax=Friedmanniomyces endolithicus TaxID=329885 RepID=A0AAN6KNZ9_9PEZI|nr:hypothetical protein LTR35_003396 [Friedmanniomyces endolithicus]KAK0293191.1 hypothetical protein LTS00_007794 [Friedmanniomyces endolithicus]KAK0304892.1 hypothetical protein LTR01_007096 [Friedmanniomyces endolithicus]KAK0319526.1 hypothetical protein LTR82_009593 [Friedmanniomyces endolithicus]KAK0823785.1 hypothetical protein LTR73_008251 [Friedmanniomyces endolithicus]